MEDAVLDLPMGKHDIDSLSEMCNEEKEDSTDSSDKLESCGKSSGSSHSDRDTEPAVILTQVESDKPVFIVQGTCNGSSSRHTDCDNMDCVKQKSSLSLSQRSDSSNSSNDIVVSLNSCSSAMSMKFCKYEKPRQGETTLSKCRSEEIYKKKKHSIDEAVSEKSKSEEIFNKEEVAMIGGSMRRARRESCELAMQNGRISPTSQHDRHL